MYSIHGFCALAAHQVQQETIQRHACAIAMSGQTIAISPEILKTFRLCPAKLLSKVHQHKSKILEQCQDDLKRFQMFIDGAAFTAKEAYAWISKGLKPDRHNFSTGYSTQHLAILAALLAQGFLNPFYKIEVDLKHYLKGKGIAIKSPGSSNPPRDFQLKKVADGFHLNSRWRCTILVNMDTGCQIEKTSPFFILKATIKIPNNLREMRLEQSQISIIKPDSNLNVLDRRAQNIFDFSFWPIIKNFRYQNDLSDYQLTFYED